MVLVKVGDKVYELQCKLEACLKYPPPGCTECDLRSIRECVQVYHGCQYYEGSCDKCEAEVGGCEGWIYGDTRFDEDVHQLLLGLDEDYLVNEEEFLALMEE